MHSRLFGENTKKCHVCFRFTTIIKTQLHKHLWLWLKTYILKRFYNFFLNNLVSYYWDFEVTRFAVHTHSAITKAFFELRVYHGNKTPSLGLKFTFNRPTMLKAIHIPRACIISYTNQYSLLFDSRLLCRAFNKTKASYVFVFGVSMLIKTPRTFLHQTKTSISSCSSDLRITIGHTMQ